jgi:hypothetical protein
VFGGRKGVVEVGRGGMFSIFMKNPVRPAVGVKSMYGSLLPV